MDAKRKTELSVIANRIMKSIKDKNVSFMENNAAQHGSVPNGEQYNQSMGEPDAIISGLEANL